jgi:long-chain acyl-CoA synthetase
MIAGPSGENIYPEDIETVLNSHVFISESLVTEQEGHLVALVHFNTEALEAKFEEWKDEYHIKRNEWEQEWEKWKNDKKKEILEFVNSKVNRFSRISEVVEEKDGFVKTPTQKIKRALYYNRKKEDSQTSGENK